jgi:predicted nucleotidyltransferase
MTSTIKSELSDITSAITANVKPDAIYLFGSYAYGTPHKDSDIDIYVVVPDSIDDTNELAAKIHFDLFKKKVRPVDLLLSRRSVFEKKRNSYFFESKIAKQGVKLYGK